MYEGHAVVKLGLVKGNTHVSPEFKAESKRKLIMRIKVWLFDNGYNKKSKFSIYARPTVPEYEVIYDSTKHSQ